MTTEGKHTKGEWKVTVSSDYHLAGQPGAFDIIGGCGCCGSPYLNPEDTGKETEQLANARLITQADALYQLMNKVAHLNPKAGEIGQGMLNTLISMAQDIKEKL